MKKSKVFYILFFVASFFLSAFILIHGDYLAIAGTLIVLLLSVYFLVDIHEKEIKAKEEQKERERLEEHYAKLSRLEDLEKAQNNIYTAIKNNNDLLSEYFSELSKKTDKIIDHTKGINEIKDLSEKNLRAMDWIHGGIKSFYELEKSGFKTIIKYNKENARQIAFNTNENMDRLINEIKEESKIIYGEIKEVGNISSVMIENTINMSKNFENLANTIDSNTDELQDKIDKVQDRMKYIPETIAFEVSKKVEKTLDSKLAKAKKAKEQAGIKNPEPMKEMNFKENTIGSTDNIKALDPMKKPKRDVEFIEQVKVVKPKETTKELKSEIKEENPKKVTIEPVKVDGLKRAVEPVKEEKPKKTIVESVKIDESKKITEPKKVTVSEPVKPVEDANGKMGQDDIATLIASMTASTSEPEPVKAEPKKVTVSESTKDANGKMGQDDIAALIASMTASTSEPEPEPVKAEPKKVTVSESTKDANGKMGEDDIAALIASMTASTSEPEPVKAEPKKVTVSEPTKDANGKMGQDDIAALIAAMTSNN